MYSIDQLKQKARDMQKFLEVKSGSEANDLIERAENLMVLMAQSGQCLADAKYLQDIAVGNAIQKSINLEFDKKLTPSTINKYVSAEAKEFNHLVNTFDRINAAATHQLDGCRSILSFRKSEMTML